MTREDAIYLLRNTAWLAPSLEPVDEAIDMAIEALKMADSLERLHEIVHEQDEIVRILDEERPKGHWIRKIVDNGWHADWVCSECGHRVYSDFIDFNYCPKCGADMRGEDCERDTDYEQAVAQLEHDIRCDPTYNPEDGSA